jgi:hypothetical protein
MGSFNVAQERDQWLASVSKEHLGAIEGGRDCQKDREVEAKKGLK